MLYQLNAIFVMLLMMISSAPTWTWVSLSITILHTVEEWKGEIWDSLNIPIWSYVLFQIFVLILGTYSIINFHLIWLFIGIRLADCIGTHWLLKKPGICTSPLLLLDALVISQLNP